MSVPRCKPLALAAVTILAVLTCAAAGNVVFSFTAALTADIERAFTPPGREMTGMFTIVCGAPTDDVVGATLAIVGVLLAGLPAAGVALALAAPARAGPWRADGRWAGWFQAGFVLQGCSLTLSMLGLLPLLIEGPTSLEQAALRGFLAANAFAGVWALPAWRTLQSDACRSRCPALLRV